MSVTFLVTGFEPFREHAVNSSWEALSWLAPRWPSDIVTRRLPVEHRAAHELLRTWLEELAPRAVLCTGLAKGSVFRMERRARKPPELIEQSGAEELRGRWPWQEMQSALERARVSVISSEDAGRYVCESTYWSLLDYRGPGPIPEFAAFLHVPPISPEHAVEAIGRAVGQVVEARYGVLRETPSSAMTGNGGLAPP